MAELVKLVKTFFIVQQIFFIQMVRRIFEGFWKLPSGFFKDHRIFIFLKNGCLAR